MIFLETLGFRTPASGGAFNKMRLHFLVSSRGLRPGTSPALAWLVLWLTGWTASAAVTGTKTALVMLVSLTDAPIDCSIAEVNGFFFTNSPLNVDSYFNHSTWGNVRWTGSVIAVSIS